MAGGLQNWLRQALATATILPLDAAAADLLGTMWAVPELKNFIISHPAQRRLTTGADLMIAAIVLTRHATLATGNFARFHAIAAHFPRLRMVDPMTGRSLP